jgi:Fe-S cluster assembly iron-binding protein IscA
MLTITPRASDAIRVILDSDAVPDGAVLRISAPGEGSPAGTSLAIEVVESAPDEDQRVQGDDVEVAVEPAAAEVLDDKELDAVVANDQVNFTIGSQNRQGGAANAAQDGGQEAPET